MRKNMPDCTRYCIRKLRAELWASSRHVLDTSLILRVLILEWARHQEFQFIIQKAPSSVSCMCRVVFCCSYLVTGPAC